MEGFEAVADEVAELIEGAILVGHNVRNFDYAMLEKEYLRLGRLCPRPKAIMDTLELVRRLKLPRPHNLGSLCSRHGIKLEAANIKQGAQNIRIDVNQLAVKKIHLDFLGPPLGYALH